jgi:hypothetical protein
MQAYGGKIKQEKLEVIMKQKNKSAASKAEVPSTKAQIPPASKGTLAHLSPEQARGQFRALLLANPNFFGNLKKSPLKPVIPITSSTNYEEIGCVGFHPQLERLEAVVYLKQSSGYDGGLCSTGSQEYVRFYLSTDDGTTWQDQGMASFTAYDIQNPGRLEYAVTLEIDPARIFCIIENLPQVRAILSWNNPPPANTPDFIPVWGNVVDATIQVAPEPFLILGKFLEMAKVQLPSALKSLVDLNQEIPATKPKVLSGAELHQVYKGAQVPGHRYLFTDLKHLAVNPAVTQATLASASSTALGKLDINLAAIIGALLSTDGDTSFEQLDCIGYDPNREALVGVFTVKLSSGYSGGLCTAGSQEYVAFWIDWGSGWSYAGTASVTTHDITAIPAGGLKYSVYLPISVASYLQPCAKGPRMPQVRAILSWQTPPPATNPNYQPTWGNRLETRILLYPGDKVEPGTANIAIIGGVPVKQINISGDGFAKSGAQFALTGAPTDPWLNMRECPFGGLVTIQGYPSLGDQYRIRVHDPGTGSDFVLKTPFLTVDQYGNASYRTPDPTTGYVTYLDPSNNIDSMLGWWSTSDNDLWWVRLEILHMNGTTANTAWYNIQLDNTLIVSGADTSPGIDIHIDSGGDCKDISAGGTVNGHFFAEFPNFGAFGLSTQPDTVAIPSNQPTTATAATSSTAAWPGDAWTLSTAGMKPCGYVVTLEAWDLTIVNSEPGSHHGASISVGFCLRANG